ncbi:unnamed protein product [Agarophyton chilense]
MLCLGRAFTTAGERRAQEDCFVVWEGVHSVWGHIALYAVLDGHCGVAAAEFVRSRLVSELFGDERWNKSVFPNCDRLLRDAVASLESALLKRSAERRLSDGTTLCLLLFVNGFMFVANVGDSRALLIRDDATHEPLTVPHSVRHPDELKRVQQAGAIVRNGRMLGPDKHLDVTRALGDRDHKLDETSALSAEPYISKRQIKHNERIVLIATDGLWNTPLLDDEELAAMALNTPDSTPLPHRAHGIVSEALKFDPRDNVTVIFLQLNVTQDQFSSYIHATSHNEPLPGVRNDHQPKVPPQFSCLHWETSLPFRSSPPPPKRHNSTLSNFKRFFRLANGRNAY